MVSTGYINSNILFLRMILHIDVMLHLTPVRSFKVVPKCIIRNTGVCESIAIVRKNVAIFGKIERLVLVSSLALLLFFWLLVYIV